MRKEFDIALRLSVFAATLTSCGAYTNDAIATAHVNEKNNAIGTLTTLGTVFAPPTETPTFTPTPTETPTPTPTLTPTPTPFSGIIMENSKGTQVMYPTEMAPNCKNLVGCPGWKRTVLINGSPVGKPTETPKSWPWFLGAAVVATPVVGYLGRKELRYRVSKNRRTSKIK